MSAVASNAGIRELLTSGLRKQLDMYLKDLAATPEEHLNSSPGGCARTPLSFTAEVAGYNGYVARYLRGDRQPIPSEEQRSAFMASIDSREKAADVLRQNTEDLIAAIESCDLNQPAEAPWGEPMPAFALAHICLLHMSYHDGQLNYAQCLHGDGEVHWF
jgi:hypothetical protein